MITFDSFKIDLATGQWHFIKEEPPTRLWANPFRDLMQQRLILGAPGDLPADYPNLASQQAYFETLGQQENFAIVAVELLNIQGVEGFSTLFKFKSPKNPMGHLFIGTMMLTFDRFFCGFHFQADEQGTTGMREAGVYMILKAQDKLPPEVAESEKQPPKVMASMDEFFDTIKSRPAMPHPSDDEQYDTAFPDHPLSRVRLNMRHLAQTIEFDDEVKRAKPFRGKEWKPAQ